MEPPSSSAVAAGDAASLDYLLWILHCSGTMRHPRSGSWSTRIFHLRYIFCILTLGYYCGIQVVLMWRVGFDDFDYFTLALSLLDTLATWIFRLRHIAKRERDFHTLAVQVRDDFGEFMAPRDVTLLRRHSRNQRGFVLAYLSLGMCDVSDTAHPIGWAAGWLYCAFIAVHIVVMNMMADAINSAQSVRETGKFGAYLCAMFTELSVYCWFGDKLMSESEKVAFAAYDVVTSMEECPVSIKRTLLLIMLRAQRPLCITAAGFFPFSRESFVSIINVSYSFFAILRNFKEE
ncbi:uncharacterized protein LOC124620132 [Schistocerca americana]|uniref:uncharacterized protein LOC124620132 n=1 Tax=Schistocerca americana TaxID=7009 RepID=UPI001F5027E2|nr:uncharacterized protein LOC124620132 [Schistocerca americana]